MCQICFKLLSKILLTFYFVLFYFDVKMQLVMITAAQWLLYDDVINDFVYVRTSLYTLGALVGSSVS